MVGVRGHLWAGVLSCEESDVWLHVVFGALIGDVWVEEVRRWRSLMGRQASLVWRVASLFVSRTVDLVVVDTSPVRRGSLLIARMFGSRLVFGGTVGLLLGFPDIPYRGWVWIKSRLSVLYWCVLRRVRTAKHSALRGLCDVCCVKDRLQGTLGARRTWFVA